MCLSTLPATSCTSSTGNRPKMKGEVSNSFLTCTVYRLDEDTWLNCTTIKSKGDLKYFEDEVNKLGNLDYFYLTTNN